MHCFMVKIFKNSRKKLKNSREKPKTQGKNSRSRSFDPRPSSKLVLSPNAWVRRYIYLLRQNSEKCYSHVLFPSHFNFVNNRRRHKLLICWRRTNKQKPTHWWGMWSRIILCGNIVEKFEKRKTNVSRKRSVLHILNSKNTLAWLLGAVTFSQFKITSFSRFLPSGHLIEVRKKVTCFWKDTFLF